MEIWREREISQKGERVTLEERRIERGGKYKERERDTEREREGERVLCV